LADLTNSKSQIALEYAYRQHEKSPEISIYWIHASNALRFEQDYLQIGINAKLPEINNPKQETKQLVKNWLNSKESGTWLMILDSADDADIFFKATETNGYSGSKRLSEFLPQCPNGSIIFTTRNKKAGVKFAMASGVILLPKMSHVDAENLLKARLEVDILEQYGIKELLGLLEYLPLAISQATSYIAENSISISEYLQMYNRSEASRIELLSEDFEDLARDSETKNLVTVTWVISFDQIRQSNTLAANLLSFMACVDRQGIPKALLPMPKSSVQLSNALGLLKAYSLITSSQSDLAFDMHRLVHLATRNWLRLGGRFEDSAKSCLVLVSKRFPSGEYGTLNTCNSYLPYAQAILDCEQLSPANDAFRALLAYKVSRYLQNRGNYNSAEILAEKAVGWRRRAFGEHDLETLASVSNLAWVLWSQGKYETAEQINRRALEDREKVLGPEHPDTLMSVSNLELVLQSQGKYEAAEQMNRRALEGREKVLGPEHPDMLTSVSNLELVLRSQGKYEAAEQMNRRALEGFEKVLGPEHPYTLTSVSNLASVLRSQGKYEAAEQMNRRAPEGREKVLGPEHPYTLTSVSNLALVLRSQGKYEAAEQMNRRALEGNEKALGPEYPNTLTSVNNLALVLQSQGKHEAAEQMNRRALEGYEKVLGFEHPYTLTSVSNLALVLRSQGKYEAAEQMNRRALEGSEKALGPEHPYTLRSLNNLASVLQSQGKYEAAKQMNRRALEGSEKVLGFDYPDTLMSLSNQAFVLQSQGKYEAAEQMNR
jgi:tetratricopeptide (TPR) repeat protein